ncbi:MAG: transcription antitermination factor NusB [Bradymonadaceae bacterium]
MSEQQTSDQQRRARRAALWILYGMDVSSTLSPKAMHQSRPTVADFDPEVETFWPLLAERVEGVLEHFDALGEEIQRVSPRWKVDRMAAVDRNILRLGAWELLHGDVPPIIVINACVELAKEYGDKNTPAFINGLLDQFCKNHGISID